MYDKDSIDVLSSQDNIIILKNPPKYIVVELIGKTSGSYKTLLPNYVLIYSLKRSCVHIIWNHDGCTLEKIVIDLSGKHANNNTYVMLSRAQRLDDLLILKPFDESILNMQLFPALHAELAHIEE
ncbi:536_t:CDS:2, partial [Cetraspora pellucida]